MAKTLQMVFQNEVGKNITISIPDVRDDVTSDEIKTLMNTIVEKNIFESIGGDLVTLMSANLVSRDTRTINVR